MRTGEVLVRDVGEEDLPAVRALNRALWHSDAVVARGRLDYPSECPGLLAEQAGNLVGALAYEVTGSECYVVAIGAVIRRNGIGSALVAALLDLARANGWARIRLITTNDNIDALRFYQRKGFRLSRLDVGAVNRSRYLKPELPETGSYGIPMRDEIELEILVGPQMQGEE
jgi:GNAT superfamily N-acetyltransferase